MMKAVRSQEDLLNILKRINGRGYPAYKDTKGQYSFGDYILSIDHVQSDPFASPSDVSVRIAHPGFPEKYLEYPYTRIALQDALLRSFRKALKSANFSGKGSGKSGKVRVSHLPQEIIERTGCRFLQDGTLILRMKVGFPAAGRKILSRELENILFQALPPVITHELFYDHMSQAQKEELASVYDLAKNQHEIREQLKARKLAAFVANGAILPRESGASDKPMKDAVPFRSPESLEVSIDLPDGSTITGMGIPDGITLIVGGGYHGKSTLLEALEAGVYDHVANDGREYVLTRDDAVKIRAEDGRSVHQDDISGFIQNLPFGRSTSEFVSEDASGSTSQAANVVEALESGSDLLLIDEDTSATNFMIRDDLMAEVVSPNQEPIIPYIARVEDLKKQGVSTILVAGSSGAYFHKADVVLQMDQYQPKDITELAKEKAKLWPLNHGQYAPLQKVQARIPLANSRLDMERIKVKAPNLDTVTIAREPIDIRYLEQLKDPEQAAAIGKMMVYAQKNLIDGEKSLDKVVNTLEDLMDQDPDLFGKDLARPRRQEIYALINRWRSQNFMQNDKTAEMRN